MTLKHSKQREMIKDFLMSRHDHPTADVVYMNVRQLNPNISLGTVYRNLTLLSELGEIQKISTGLGPDRFDGNPHPHCHFQCKKCFGVLDIPFESEMDLNSLAAKHFPGIIEGHHIQFYGFCPDCMETH